MGLYNKVMLEATPESTGALTAALNQRMLVDKRFNTMFPVHMEAFKKGETPIPTDYECYRNLIDTYEVACGKFDDYSEKYTAVLAAECEGIKSAPELQAKSVTKITNACK